MTEWEADFIASRRVARLATVDEKGQPHVVPVVYVFDGVQIYTPIDEKPKRVEAYRLRRVRNIQANDRVALIIDDYDEDWQQLAWVQVRGRAKILAEGEAHRNAIRLLREKYPQYRGKPLTNRPVIAVLPDKVTSWRGA